MNGQHFARKSSLAAALVVALSVGMAACAGTSEDPPPQPPGSVTAPAPGEAPPLAPGEAPPPMPVDAPPIPENAPPPTPGDGVPVSGDAVLTPVSSDEGDGPMIADTATLDKVQADVRVILALDVKKRAFVGTIANATKNKVCGVRVTVRLENGATFGPTKATDLAASGSAKIEVPTDAAEGNKWGARVEIAPCGIGG